MDQGVTVIRRETFLSALDLTREVLRRFGSSEQEINHAIETFRDLDRRHLYDDYAHYNDLEKLQDQARKFTEELEELFNRDMEDIRDTSSDTSK